VLEPVRVLVVDDHPVVREGLRAMLSTSPVEIVGEAASAAEAVALAADLAPDAVLLDLGLPDSDGLSLLPRLKAAAPRAAVVVVTMHDDQRLVRRAIEAGAAGYLLKGAGRRELLAALSAVRDGNLVVDPALIRGLLADAVPAAPDARRRDLSPVEEEVLRLVADGLTNREIAGRMRWSVGTVKKYVQQILDKLDVSDRTQAAVEAIRRGFLR
jgi:DNA-binding NarL/FixJ family response regulator